MSDIDGKVELLNTQPGFRRDGTMMDGNFWNDGQWVRFNRGRPKKMGGFRRITNLFSGISRRILVWTRGAQVNMYSFSPMKIEMLTTDKNGIGNSVIDRSPASFAPNNDYLWSISAMYDAAAGSTQTIILACAFPSLTNIDDTTGGSVYWASAADSSVFQAIPSLSVSGGLLVAEPYAIYYGSDGSVTWSNANEPRTLPGSAAPGDAGTARPTATKIVQGLAVAGTNGPSAVLWSLDSVLRMDFVGGPVVFRISTITKQSSIMARNSVIEYDGIFYWIGIDRFLMYASGGSVQEVQNDHNRNWFFDNVNPAARNKIWAYKYPRYGEIWWFFPFGTATECDHAIIYNVRENYWYDVALSRTAGYYPQVFYWPVMSEVNTKAYWLRGNSAVNFNIGDRITGVNSLAKGTLINISSNDLTVDNVIGTYIAGEVVNSTSGGASTLSLVFANGSSNLYMHEFGTDSIIGDNQVAIDSYVESCDIELLNNLATQSSAEGDDHWTRLLRVEPDFVQSGQMYLTVISREFPQSPDIALTPQNTYTFQPTDGKIDTREQARLIRLKFGSNVAGGNYEMGKVLIHEVQGDTRS